MCDEAWSVIRGTMMVCCALVFAAIVIIIGLGGMSPSNYHLYLGALELAKSPPALLLTAALVSVCIEEQVRGKR